jgi:hypothetical protein
MSLPQIAQHMSSYGRNGDTMLVHMTPSEVHGLQALAEKHGTTLTINPDTGLPEAFGLKDLVKAAAPIALGAILGPAGIGLASSAMGAGLMVGGVTALATGNLQQGLMAGLGAYGGFGMSEGLAGLGGQALAEKTAEEAALSGADLASDQAFAANQANAATNLANAGISETTTGAQLKAAQDAAAQYGLPTTASPFNAAQTGQTVQTVTQAPAAQPGYFDKVSAGFDRATSKGGLDALSAQMKTNAASSMGGPSSVLGGAGYIAAGALGSGAFDEKQDLSKAKQDPGYIRQYDYNPYGQKYTAFAPVKADQWGSRSFEDAFKAADGGIVALAGGGDLASQRLEAYKQYEAEQQPQATPQVPPQVAPQAVQQAVQADPYNTMTGGSKAAYDYLTGSGEYPTRPFTPTGEIYKPYSEAVMGMKADPTQFETVFNPKTRTYEDNPNFKSFNFDPTTGATSRGMDMSELSSFLADPNNLKAPVLPADGSSSFGRIKAALDAEAAGKAEVPAWMAANNLTYEQVAKAQNISVAAAKKKYPVTGTVAAPVIDYGSGGANGGLMPNALKYAGGGLGTLGGYSDGGRLLRGPGDGVSDSIPASIGSKQPARLADGEFVVPARIVSELGNGSTEAGARKLYAMMDRVQKARGKTTGKGKVAANSRSDKYLPA